MEQEDINIELISDKAIMEALVSKEALSSMDAKLQQVPPNYFDEFPTAVLEKIRSEKNKTKIIHFAAFRKIAIAAAVLLITATGYLFSDKILQNKNEIVIVAIEEIPNEEIQKYIESNEVFVEVDWQNEIDKASTDLELNYIPFNNDTN
jgi:ActR/RegA family two-component response regulator